MAAILPCQHSEAIYGGKIACITPDGEIEWQVEKKQQIAGSHESNLSFKSIGSTHLYLDGNPAKWLQGHNLFGLDNLVALIERVMSRLIPLLRLTPIFFIVFLSNLRDFTSPLKDDFSEEGQFGKARKFAYIGGAFSPDRSTHGTNQNSRRAHA